MILVVEEIIFRDKERHSNDFKQPSEKMRVCAWKALYKKSGASPVVY
jgi:hypothetical protein